MTLADEDANTILTDDAKRVTLGNVLTNVEPPSGQPGGQISNQRKWRHVVANFATNAIGATR